MNWQVEIIKEREKELRLRDAVVRNDTGGDDLFAKVTRNYKIFDRLEAIFADKIYVYRQDHAEISWRQRL